MDYQIIKALEETIEEIKGWENVIEYNPDCAKDALKIFLNKLKEEKEKR